jgi:phage terminase large subunit GpA-like protein
MDRSPIDLGAVFDAALRPDPALLPSEWADAHRILSSVESGEPGRWRTDRTPYLREILDRLAPTDPTERVVVMKGSQVGGTEVSLNWVGYCIACSPGPILAVQPTVEMGKRWSKGRLAPMIASTPALSQLVAPARERDSGNTLAVKEFSGGVLVITGANSAVGLRSMPVQRLILDEVDAYPDDADDEGDPVDLAVKRTSTFASRRKILMISTPTIKGGSRIERAFLDSDQRRFWVPCPACGEFRVIRWADIRWPEGEPRAAKWHCPSCGYEAGNHEKTAMLVRGEWRPTAPGDGKTAGYHLPSLLAPHGWDSWGDIAAEFAESRKDPARLKVWVNTRLGETWEEQGDELGSGSLTGRIVPDWGEQIPTEVQTITTGTDVQENRVETITIGWGAGWEWWVLDYAVILSDPLDKDTWLRHDQLIRREWQTADGRRLRAAASCVDSGHRFQQVLEYCQPRRKAGVFAVKGLPGKGPIWDRKIRRSAKAGGRATFHAVHVDVAKDDLYAMLRAESGPRSLHVPVRILQQVPDFEAQLTAERRVRKVDRHGRTVTSWKLKSEGRRNEVLDACVYALAAAHSLSLSGLRFHETRPIQSAPIPPPAAPESPQSTPSLSTPVPGDTPVRPAPARRAIAPTGWNRGGGRRW